MCNLRTVEMCNLKTMVYIGEQDRTIKCVQMLPVETSVETTNSCQTSQALQKAQVSSVEIQRNV
jgi:hypothetical protein